ncbi:peroxiredoxin family protein [Arcobacteraceae bacterium]|jgi:peroxiredoxin|nr:peroxiredoxin family protein [Arcobacteraceae bacterium]
MKKILIILAMIFSINNLNAVELGQKAPNFEATTISGKQVSLEQFKGKKAVWLVFWATWCPYCTKEIPALKELHKKYGDKIEILAINIGVRDSVEKSQDYKFEHDLPYDIIFSNEITRQYEVRGTPTQIVIDAKGVVAFKGTRVPKNITDENIQALLAK